MGDITRRATLATVALGGLGLAGCAQPPFKLGFIGGLTGRISDLGVAGRDGALLALEQADAAGGVKGRKVELLTADDQHDAEVARKALLSLKDAGVAAVVGPMTSAMAVAMVPVANEAGVLLVSPTVTTSALSGLDDQFFRVISSTREYAVDSARYHALRGGLRRIAAILDLSNAAYTEHWLADYEAEFGKHGGSVLRREGYTFRPGMAFADIAKTALTDRPDGLLLLTGAVDAAQLLQQLRKLQPTLPVMTAEWAATEQFLALAGSAAEGVVSAQFVDRLSPEPGYQRFLVDFQQRFGRRPGFAEPAAFDATRVVLQALAVQAPGETLKQALLRVRRFEGIQQPIEFSDTGDALRKTFLTRVRGGRYEVLA